MARFHIDTLGIPGTRPRILGGVDLVIFDFDGVIADSEVLSLGSLAEALDDHGLPMTLEDVRHRFLGSSLATILKYVAENSPHHTAEGFTDSWQARLFKRFRAELKPLPMILQVLDWLKSHQIRHCIASSSSFERIGIALESMGLEDRFPNIFSAEQVDNGKPAPDLFLLSAERMGVHPGACLVIEDSPYGIQAAKAASMRVFGFIDGAHLEGMQSAHKRLLLDLGAERVLSGYSDLLCAD